jgi:hypothetical protein
VCVVPLVILAYLEIGRLGRTAYLHQILLKTGGKGYENFKSVESTCWRADSRKNTDQSLL